MKVPFLKELNIKNFKVSSLILILKKNRIGRTPLSLDLLTYNENETLEILKNLKSAIIRLGVNPRFPYPIYIITDKVNHYEDLPIMKRKKDISSFYIGRRTNINRREALILSKLYILLEKINNHNVTKECAFIKSQSNQRSYLKDLSYESSIYRTILKENRDDT